MQINLKVIVWMCSELGNPISLGMLYGVKMEMMNASCGSVWKEQQYEQELMKIIREVGKKAVQLCYNQGYGRILQSMDGMDKNSEDERKDWNCEVYMCICE